MYHNKHPRLLYNEHDISRFRAAIERDEEFRTAWQEHLQKANELLEEELISEEYADAVATQHGNYFRPSGQAVQMALYCGLAYHVTGDTRYAEKLRRALLHYGAYKKWYGSGVLRNQPPWHSELNTARFCFAFAIGLDALYHYLSPGDRATMTDAVVRLGILPTLEDWVLPATRIHALDSMGHNWWSVCVSEAGLAALAVLEEEPRAAEWIQAVCNGLEEWFTYQGNVLQNKSPNFDQAGAFYESVHYATYALQEYLYFRMGLVNTLGPQAAPHTPVLDRVGDFFLHTCYPTATDILSVNFGDGPLRSRDGETAALLLANGYNDPRLRWFLWRTGEHRSLLGLLYGGWKEEVSRPDALGNEVAYTDIGWAVLRSGWHDDATMLALKSGFTWNHAHADAGSFVLYHAGRPLIIDSGTCSYDRREYPNYYRLSRAHNVILFNGAGEDPETLYRGVKHPGRVFGLLSHAGVRYVCADATGPMARWFMRNYRHFLWIDDVILVIDDVRAHEPGTFQWLLHYAGQAEMTPAGLTIANGPARAHVRMLFPTALTMSEEVGLADHQPDEKVTYLSFSPSGESQEAKFITAIVPEIPGEALPQLTPLEGPEMLGVRLAHKGHVTDVCLNLQADGRRMHVNSNNIIAGWDTDAYILVLRRPQDVTEAAADPTAPGALEHCLVICGSYLRRDGRVVFDALSKADAAFTLGSDRMSVVLHGQPGVRAAVWAPRPPQTVTVNGEPQRVDFDGSAELVRFRVAGH